MNLIPIDDLPPDVLDVIRELAHCACEQEGPYKIRTRIQAGNRSTRHEYTIRFEAGIESSSLRLLSCRLSIENLIRERGYVDFELNDPPGTFFFSGDGLTDLVQQFPPSDAEVRRYIGHFLYAAWQESPRQLLSSYHIDVEPFRARRAIRRPQFDAQANLLISQGLAEFSGYSENHVEDGYLWLTDSGRNWASAGFPDSGAQSNSTTNVQIEVNVINVLPLFAELDDTDLPPELRDEVKDLADDIRSEPTIEKIARMFGMAANIHTLARPILSFFSENGSAILNKISGL